LPFFLWGVDSKVEDEIREGTLSMAEPPNPEKILAIRLIAIFTKPYFNLSSFFGGLGVLDKSLPL